MSSNELKRIALGLTVAFVILTLLDFAFPQFSRNVLLKNVQIATGYTAAFGAGGYIAQRRFLIPSLFCTFAIWASTVYLVIDIAKPLGQSRASVVVGNLPTLPLIVSAAAVGSMLGMCAYKLRSKGRAGTI